MALNSEEGGDPGAPYFRRTKFFSISNTFFEGVGKDMECWIRDKSLFSGRHCSHISWVGSLLLDCTVGWMRRSVPIKPNLM